MSKPTRAIPLPGVLSGETITRSITLDRALLFIINGALSALVDITPYEQTGDLTVDDARAAFETMLDDFYAQDV